MARKAQAVQQEVNIPAMNLVRSQITIEGLSPLITHRFSDKSITEIEDKQQGKAKAPRRSRVPQEEFEAALYLLPKAVNGCKYGVPAAAIKKAVVFGAYRLAEQDTGPTKGGFHIVGDILPIKGSAPTMRTDMVKQGMARVPRYRPQFDVWSVEFEVDLNASVLSLERLVQLIDIAGFGIGIGDWRPEKNGSFGRFRVKR